MTEQEWEQVNGSQLSAIEVARWGTAIRTAKLVFFIVAVVSLMIVLTSTARAQFVAAHHAERGPTSYGCASLDISGNVLSVPCGSATRFGSIRYTRGPGGGSSGAIIAVGIDGQAVTP